MSTRDEDQAEIDGGWWEREVDRAGRERVVDFLQAADASRAFDQIDLRRYNGDRLRETKSAIRAAREAADAAYRELAWALGGGQL